MPNLMTTRSSIDYEAFEEDWADYCAYLEELDEEAREQMEYEYRRCMERDDDWN